MKSKLNKNYTENLMYATRLQHLCDKYSGLPMNYKKVTTTQQPPAVNAGPSGLYDNYQRGKDQELMEEAVFMNTGLLPTAITKFSAKYTHKDLQMIQTNVVKDDTTVTLMKKTIANEMGLFTRNKAATSSQMLCRSLPCDSTSILKLSTRSLVQIPHKELDRMASSRAEEIEIDSIKAEQHYSAKIAKTALSHRSFWDTLL